MEFHHDYELYHVYETKETIFMALELLDGGCLWNHITRIGPIAESYALYYAACILTSLRYLQSQQIIYRDMKAENIVLDSRGRPKLIDFGMAKRMRHPCPGSVSQVPGKLKTSRSAEDSHTVDEADFDKPPTRYYFAAYLAPEIYDHDEQNCYAIDSWGLGYIITEMTLGYGIFLSIPWEETGTNHLETNWTLDLDPNDTMKLTPACNDLIQRTLVRKPSERPLLDDVVKHRFFARVPWSKLTRIRGPDLTKNIARDSKIIDSGLKSARSDSNLARQVPPTPDTGFLHEFYGATNIYMMSIMKSKQNYYAAKKNKVHQEAVTNKSAITVSARNQSSSQWGRQDNRSTAAVNG